MSAGGEIGSSCDCSSGSATEAASGELSGACAVSLSGIASGTGGDSASLGMWGESISGDKATVCPFNNE